MMGSYMRNIKFLIKVTLLVVVTMVASAGAQQPMKANTPATINNRAPKTLAILPFENNSVTDPELYQPLTKGLSAMLITDLENNIGTLKLIERDKIQALLKEIALSQSGSIDQSTAIKAGKILGAQATTFGSFMVLGKQVRIDARIVKVETSEVLMAESILGNSDDFIHLEQELAGKIAQSLNASFKRVSKTSKSDIGAAIYFSKGLDAYDRGDLKEAKHMFDKSIKLDATYRKQVENIGGMKK